MLRATGDAAAGEPTAESSTTDPDSRRDDLTLIRERHARTRDSARPEAMATLRGRGRRSARENIADLVDAGSFVEYGPLALAAQRGRRNEEDLVTRTPADGRVCGLATIDATADANIGMGGPAMIEGGGLGVHRPEDIGPAHVQRRTGVIHLLARDEAHAVALARRYLSYFQGPVPQFQAPDSRLARHAVPQDRLRAYDTRAAIATIADVNSVLELRPDYGTGAVTALVRVEGVAYGVIANTSGHLGGAIDGEAADKMTDFLTLC